MKKMVMAVAVLSAAAAFAQVNVYKAQISEKTWNGSKVATVKVQGYVALECAPDYVGNCIVQSAFWNTDKKFATNEVKNAINEYPADSKQAKKDGKLYLAREAKHLYADIYPLGDDGRNCSMKMVNVVKVGDMYVSSRNYVGYGKADTKIKGPKSVSGNVVDFQLPDFAGGYGTWSFKYDKNATETFAATGNIAWCLPVNVIE